MENNGFKLGALVFCLLLLASVGFADKGKKALPSKATIVKENLKQLSQKEQPAVEIKPVKLPETPLLSPSAADDKGKQIKWQVVSSGAEEGGTSVTFRLRENPGYVLSGTVGQLAVGAGSSDSYNMNSGYWQSFEECAGRGDANGDGVINSADVVYLINYLFKGGPSPEPLCNGDVNCDGIINSADVVYLINYLFKGGPPPGC